MKKNIIIMLFLSFVMFMIIIFYYPDYKNFQTLKKHENKVSDLIERVLFPYFRTYLSYPNNFRELEMFAKSESYHEIEFLSKFEKNLRFNITDDSCFLFLCSNENNYSFDNSLTLKNSNVFDYIFFKKEITIFQSSLFTICETELITPMGYKENKFFSDDSIFPNFHKNLSSEIKKLYTDKVDFDKLTLKSKLYVEVEIIGDSLKLINIIPCDDFPMLGSLMQVVRVVLSGTKIENSEYTKVIIPIMIHKELIIK